ncbi:hypothetical protein D3C81_1480740 [compost metagenome]
MSNTPRFEAVGLPGAWRGNTGSTGLNRSNVPGTGFVLLTWSLFCCPISMPYRISCSMPRKVAFWVRSVWLNQPCSSRRTLPWFMVSVRAASLTVLVSVLLRSSE